VLSFSLLEMPMRRIRLLPLLFLITGTAVLTLRAQQPAQQPASDSPRSFAYLVPFIPPIPGAPVTAKFVIQVEQPLPGGGSETWHGMTLVARDSSGRTLQALHELVPSSVAAPPPLYTVLSDPVSRLRKTLDPVHRTYVQEQFRISPLSQSVSGRPEGEDLGNKFIDGLEVKGIRRTWMISSEVSDSGKPDRVVDETWYSKELGTIVSERQTDSAGRVVTVAISHLDRSEPPAALFRPPHGYNVSGQVPARFATWAVTPPDWDPNAGSAGGGCLDPNCFIPIGR
jgi:hypothetical protein